MNELTGRVAVVTGASRGIGAGIAKGLAAAGATVVVNYATHQEAADRVVAQITSQGGKALALQGDLAKAAEVRRLFEQTQAAFGALDVLVNNAGVFRFEPLEAVTEEEFHREFNLNVLGTILAIQEAVKYFSSRGGSVINVSSMASYNPTPNAVVYAATKGAVDAITRTLARELGPRKIRVNTLTPGGVPTDGLQELGFVAGGDLEKMLVARTTLGRMGQPEDIARVAVFLASDSSGWVTGERLTVSGGYW